MQDQAQLQAIRSIVLEILELEDNELRDDGHFVDEYEADSLRAIEILARLETKFGISIPQNELPKMNTVRNVYAVVCEHAGWV
jgi:acyl carrier protein